MPRHWLGAVVLLVATAASAGTLPKASAPVSPASAIVLAPKASAPIAAISAVAPVHEPRESRENSANIDPVSGEKPVDWFARIAASIGILLGIGNVFFAIWKLTRDEYEWSTFQLVQYEVVGSHSSAQPILLSPSMFYNL